MSSATDSQVTRWCNDKQNSSSHTSTMKKLKSELEAALNKLKTGKGNLIGRAQKLDELGAKTTKKLPGHLVDDEITPHAPQELFPENEANETKTADA